MTDYTDLIARLRFINRNYDLARSIHGDISAAADAIAALQAEVARLREALQNEEKAFQRYQAATSEDFPRTLERDWMNARYALQAEVARLRELPQPTVALSERPLFSHVITPVVAHDDGSQTILDQSGNGRHWHIPAKE